MPSFIRLVSSDTVFYLNTKAVLYTVFDGKWFVTYDKERKPLKYDIDNYNEIEDQFGHDFFRFTNDKNNRILLNMDLMKTIFIAGGALIFIVLDSGTQLKFDIGPAEQERLKFDIGPAEQERLSNLDHWINSGDASSC